MTNSRPATIGEVLLQLATEQPARHDLVTYQHSDRPRARLGGAELLARAQRAAAAMREHGVTPGDRVLLMLTSQMDFVDAFLGAVWADAVPVPLFPPVFARKPEEFIANFGKIAITSGAHILVASDEIVAMINGVAEKLGRGFRILPRSAWNDGSEKLEQTPQRGAGDLALLQFTSGSTGTPKGVALSHANVLANAGAIGRAVELNRDDVGVCWLPLYHDMGLIGVLATLYWGGRVVLLSPLDFAKDPGTWLRAISDYRGTLSPAPNFAYRRCLRIPDEELAGIDLSSWRVAFDGSEPIDPATVRKFTSRFAPFGFRAEALYPVYGLAEHTLAVSFPALGEGPTVDTVDRSALATAGIAEPVPEDHPDALGLVSVGTPLAGVSVEIHDEQGSPLPDSHVGEILVSSSSVMRGYFGNEAATAAVLADGWLKTGDLGYLRNGMLYITGRIKDIIIRAGRNYYPTDIESVAVEVAGSGGGRAAAFSIPASNDEEHVVVLAESDLAEDRQDTELVQHIAAAVAARVGFRPECVQLCARGVLPVTSSGKVQRRLARERFLSGGL